MKARLNSFQAAPKSMQALLDFSETVQKSGLEHSLLCLIEIARLADQWLRLLPAYAQQRRARAMARRKCAFIC